MPPNVALSGTELTNLKAPDHQAPYYLSFRSDVVIATANVAITPSGASVLVITVNNTSANWNSKIREGMCALITNAAGTVRRGYYRVRRGSGTATLLLEQISFADPGSIANANRSDIIQQGDAISILERFDLYSMKPYSSNSVIYQDGDIAIGTHNTQPEVIVNVSINGYPGDFVTMIASDGGTQHISAVITISKWPTSSGSTVSYAWIYPASWTNVSGASTATLGADVPPGDYMLYCDVTDSIGGLTEIARWVRIHSPGDPPLAVNITADDETRQGRKMTVRAVQGIIGPIPPGAKCCITGPYTWGGADVATANHTFIGYLYNQPFAHEPNYYESHADILGVGLILDKLFSLPITLKYAGTPVNWEEVASSLSTVQFAIWWTLRWRCANALKCFNFTDFSLSGTIARRQNIPVPQGTIYSQLKALADMYDANVGSRPDGEIIVQRLPSILQDRSGVATRCTLDNSIYGDVYPTWQRRNEYGDVFHSGFYISDALLTADVVVQGEAPGLQSYGQGGKTDKKTGKVYETQVDNEIRVGYWLELLNNEYPQIKVDIPNNWDVFVMADLNRVVVNVPAGKSPTGSAISITCIPVSFSKTWIPGRRAKLSMILEAETTGTAGENAPVPPVQTPVPPTVNPIVSYQITPALSPVPDAGGTVTPIMPAGTVHKYPINGDVLSIADTSGSVWITPNFISLKAPHWNNITPGSLAGTAGTLKAVQPVFDPFGRGTALGLYALTANAGGSQSQVQFTPNAALQVPLWTPGTMLGSAVYQTLRATLAQAGGVLLYDPGSGANPQTTFNFLTSTAGFQTVPPDPNDPNCMVAEWGGTWVSGSGWKATTADQHGDIIATCVNISSLDTSLTITSCDVEYNSDNIAINFFSGPMGPLNICSPNFINGQSTTNGSPGIYTFTFTPTGAAVHAAYIMLRTVKPASADGYIRKLTIHYAGGARGCQVVYSSDHGATFGAPQTVGGTTGAGAFDAQRAGGISVAGGYGTLYQATSLGGAYTARNSFGSASPAAAIIPWYTYNSTTALQTSSGSVDAIVGLDSGTLALAWVLASGGTIDISPASGAYPAGPDAITCAYGRWIDYLSASGTLYESNTAGSTWGTVSAFSGGPACRVRRNDTSWLTNRGQLYALDSGGTAEFSSHVVGYGALYPRVMSAPAVRFDSYP